MTPLSRKPARPNPTAWIGTRLRSRTGRDTSTPDDSTFNHRSRNVYIVNVAMTEAFRAGEAESSAPVERQELILICSTIEESPMSTTNPSHAPVSARLPTRRVD